MADDARKPDVALLYRDTRERLTALVAGLDEAAAARPVPACPGWSVRDVLAHLAAAAEDASAGLLAGPPTDHQTAAQVARFACCGLPEILTAWDQAAPGFERLIAAARVWPAVIDVVSHEHDIRGGLGRPGARDTEAIRHCTDRLLRSLRPPVPLRVIVEDAEFQAGPGAPSGTPVLTLTTTRFEAFRWRMGRRSQGQLAALDWSGDPEPVLGYLVVFGPAPRDVWE